MSSNEFMAIPLKPSHEIIIDGIITVLDSGLGFSALNSIPELMTILFRVQAIFFFVCPFYSLVLRIHHKDSFSETHLFSNPI